jgi:hypothetical protein
MGAPVLATALLKTDRIVASLSQCGKGLSAAPCADSPLRVHAAGISEDAPNVAVVPFM